MAKELIYKVTPAPVRDEEAEKAAKAAATQNVQEIEGGGTITTTPNTKIWKAVPVGDDHMSALQSVGGICKIQNNEDHAVIHILEEPIHTREIAQLRLRQIFGAEPDYQGFNE